MLTVRDLPAGNAPAPVSLPHFPTRWQAVLWRNRGLVPLSRLAAVLHSSEQTLREAASGMGLGPEPEPEPDANWLIRGYLTLIRANWHLLPYEQILELLDWTPDRMAYTLKEEDFFWHKLGLLKPDCRPVLYSALTGEQKAATEKLRADLQKYFVPEEMTRTEKAFSFLDRFAPVPRIPGRDRFEFNFIHAYPASCGDVLGNADVLDPAPENLLAEYASRGIRGIWFHALLHLLIPIPGAEEFSPDCAKRIENLKKITARCEKYGIKVYLYFNEPRCMPLPFYEKKPLWAGLDVPQQQTKTVCTTRSPEPLAWLENAVRTLFGLVPSLGGLFAITESENPTNCHYTARSRECPSCRNTPPEKIIADIIGAMERGMHASAPDAKMIVYDWAWSRSPDDPDKISFKKAVLDRLPKNIWLLSVSEWGKITHVGGVEQSLVDYSISQVGPSEESLAVWKHAQELGIPVAAKVQLNNSWELSAIPCIPVPYLIREHLDNLEKAGVKALMLSWTLGGFPGGNLELLSASPETIAKAKFHPGLAEKICEAWKAFSQAFREFPFAVEVLYTAPMNYGPMNLLHLKPTGYAPSMIGFPYDGLDAWRGPYPADVFQNQFRLLTEGWKRGLDILKQAGELVAGPQEEKEYREILIPAEAGYCHFRSTWLQIRFIRARDRKDAAVMRECAEEEIRIARNLYEIARKDSRIGFEASNHYFYTLNDLREKVVSCARILEELAAC